MGLRHGTHLYEAIAKDPRHHEKEMKALFKRYDKNKDGKINGDEAAKFAKEFLEYLKKLNKDEGAYLSILSGCLCFSSGL